MSHSQRIWRGRLHALCTSAPKAPRQQVALRRAPNHRNVQQTNKRCKKHIGSAAVHAPVNGAQKSIQFVFVSIFRKFVRILTLPHKMSQ